jgi:hypothetical protein
MGFSLPKLGAGGKGGFSSLADPLNIFGGNQATAGNTVTQAGQTATGQVQAGTAAAQTALKEGQAAGTEALKTGFQAAADTTTGGYNTAKENYAADTGEAVDTAKTGFAAAQAATQSPNMVQTRQDLYQQLLGEGGLSDDVLNSIEGKVREEYGTGLRGAEQATSQFLGDSQARGLAGEQVARAAATLGGARANAVRDIEVQNAMLAEEEKNKAMETTIAEAYQQAGLDARSAEYISGLQTKIAEGGANLTTQETTALANLAAQKGMSLADLISKIATSGAALSAEEAQALANISLGTGTNMATLQTQPHGFQSLLGMG